ncbi:hypothetical protein ACFFKU_01095 [Kineococcus gynurae]|uniref:Uncharacterized protein n=1 Tax=Kineococcus gynurae TaxID=452979 RepID=A0ABV5LPX9_9ACTN
MSTDPGTVGDEGGDRRHDEELPDRRRTVDLTRAERGEPERRAFPGLERRGTAGPEREQLPEDD